jgi:hypothetical protein
MISLLLPETAHPQNRVDGTGKCSSHTTPSSCNPVNTVFTDEGKRDKTWNLGKTWGLRYPSGRSHPGGLFTIVLQKEVPNSPKPVAIGPNPVLIPPMVPKPAAMVPPTAPKRAAAASSQIQRTLVMYPTAKGFPFSRYPVWELVTKTFKVLNTSPPNLTKECWLCLNTQPPFSTGIAIIGNHSQVTLSQCSWGLSGKLSLQQVTGTGTCARSPSVQPPAGLCNQTINISSNT